MPLTEMKSHPMKKKNQLRVSRIRGCGCLFALGLILFGLFDFLVSSPYSEISWIHKAQVAEAKSNIGAMNRAQQAYFLEYEEFSDSFQVLDIGIKNPTKNYDYSIRATPLAVFNYATSRKKYLKGYVGAVFLDAGDERTGEALTVALICEPQSPVWLSNWFNISRPADPILRDGRLECGPHTKPLHGDTTPVVLEKDAVSAYNSLNYAATGQYDPALQVLETIKSPYFKVRVLEAIAPQLTTAQQYDKALKITKSITGLKIAESITDDSNKVRALEAIAPKLTTAQQYDEALKIAKSITNDYDRESALQAIARYRNSPKP